ncbi:MAG TPA: hypothetical protein VF432_23135 [Thermoanaerobaculia bacterium]
MTLGPIHSGGSSFWSLVRRAATPPAARAALTDPAAADEPKPPEIPPAISEWLGRAMLLYGVPFEYTIAHPALLPDEAIRFFYFDRNWLYRLVDGAVSVGVGSSADYIQLYQQFEALALAAAQKAVVARASLRGKAARTDAAARARIDLAIDSGAADADTWTGFLLRSTVVSGWPGMEVHAFDAADQPLQLLRVDRLTPNVLLCIIRGVPGRVALMEPPEALHFGVLKATSGSGYDVVLRGLGYGGYEAGIQLTGSPAPSAAIPVGANGVVNVQQAATNLKAALAAKNALSPQGTFTSSEFGVQMVLAAGLQNFKPQGK